MLEIIMEEVFSRTWFSRLWTVQEVALGKIVVVHCGNSHVPFNVLYLGSEVESQFTTLGEDEHSVARGTFVDRMAIHLKMVLALKQYKRHWAYPHVKYYAGLRRKGTQ